MHIGTPELVIILLLIMLLFGVGRVGKVAGELGKGLAAFRKGLKRDEAKPQASEDLAGVAPIETGALETAPPPNNGQGAIIKGDVDTKGGDFIWGDKIIHTAQPLPVGDNTLLVFVSSLEAQAVEREAVGQALDKTLNLFSRTKTDFTISSLRSPEDVKQGLGKRTYFILFATPSPSDSQINENRLARKACVGKRLLLAPSAQVKAAAEAFGEPQKEFLAYTPEQNLVELIFGKLVRLETENAGKNGNPHNLSHDALLVLAGLGGGLGLGIALEPLKELIEQIFIETDFPKETKITPQKTQGTQGILENPTNESGSTEILFQVAGDRSIVGNFPTLDDPTKIRDVLRKVVLLEFVDRSDTLTDVDTTIQTDIGQATPAKLNQKR